MLIPISPAGEYGVISDVAPLELPLNAWSAAKNMHFPAEGYAEKVLGYRNLFGGASIAPFFLATVRPVSGNAFWVYAGQTAVYCYDSGHHNITRAAGAYSAAGANKWQGGIMNGLLYLNNSVDKPQVWSPAQNTQLLVDLPNWPANTTAAVVRSFKNYMVALDVMVNTTRDARKVKWSHPADPGTYPSSWDHTDPTKDAGEISLAETEGINIDCLTLRGDVNLIYKDDSVWGMQFVGGANIFRFYKVFGDLGIMGLNCAVEYTNGRHFVFARDDVFTHDGQTKTPILRARDRTILYNNLDSTNAGNSRVYYDAANAEIWICYPETGQSRLTKALIWNWQKNSIGHRDLPNIAAIGVGVADPSAGSDNWDAAIGGWDSDTSFWGQTSANPAQTRMVMAVPSGNYLYGIIPDTADADGTAFTSLLERRALLLPFDPKLPPDINAILQCNNIWPRITGTMGGIVQVRLGTQMNIDSDPSWGPWQNYTIGTTTKLDCMLTGRLFAIQFRSTQAIQWKLHSYSLDVEQVGYF